MAMPIPHRYGDDANDGPDTIIERLRAEIENAQASADDAEHAAGKAERLLERLTSYGATELLSDEGRALSDLVEVCKELTGFTVWSSEYRVDNLRRLVEKMREHARKAVAA